MYYTRVWIIALHFAKWILSLAIQKDFLTQKCEAKKLPIFLHSFVCLLVYKLYTLQLIHLFIYCFINLLLCYFIHSFIYCFINSLLCRFLRSFIPWLINLLPWNFICSFIHWFIYSLLRNLNSLRCVCVARLTHFPS